LVGAAGALKDSLSCQEYAAKSRFLQLLDPRIKTFTFALFILLVLFAGSITVVLSLYIFCLLLAAASGISLVYFLKRTLLFIPLFSLFIVLPALFSQISPGEALLRFNIFGAVFMVTRQGLDAAVIFLLRVTASVSCAVLLALTTKHDALLRVLRIFKVPHIFVLTLGICYRYVFLFIQVIENTYLSVKSRVGTAIHYKSGQRIVAWNMANLWQRSLQLNSDVYNAMLSRGYRGEPAFLDDFKSSLIDWLWLCFVLFIFIFLTAKQFLFIQGNYYGG
jgi:cobalt/nickel transport system permease protein